MELPAKRRAERRGKRKARIKLCINPLAIRLSGDFCNPELDGEAPEPRFCRIIAGAFLVALGLVLRERGDMKTPRSALIVLTTLLLTLAPAFASGWGDNYKEALATAAKENKKVLLDFTGSDWCGWCMKLKKETFDHSQFKDYADKNLVLVEVDFPQGKTLPPDVKKQNDALQEQYSVQGFPTLVLLDPQGKLIKQNSGYLPGGPQAFIDWVNAPK